MKIDSLPPQSIGAFRTFAEAEVAMPRCTVVGKASRIELSRAFLWERRIKDFLTLTASEKEKRKEEGR